MKAYLWNLAIALDQLAHALIGGSCDETFSARAYREDWMIQHLINLLFWDKDHCKESYESERNRTHLPEEYRNASL